MTGFNQQKAQRSWVQKCEYCMSLHTEDQTQADLLCNIKSRVMANLGKEGMIVGGTVRGF